MFDVVVVGSLNVDLVVRTTRLPAPGETVSGQEYREFAGGKGLNQAVAAARAGATVALVGATGDDAAGKMVRSLVIDEGIDDTWLTTVANTATGRAMITVDDRAENSIVVVAGANAAVTWPDDPPIGTVTLAQLEIPIQVVVTALGSAHAAGSLTILNPAPATPLPASLLAQCSIVVPNQHEADALGGSATLHDAGVAHVVVTRGADGVDVVGDDATMRIEAFDVSPTDTTGAGDSFCGNLSARLARHDSLVDAVTWGAAAGALATTVNGAVPSLPTASKTERLLKQRRR